MTPETIETPETPAEVKDLAGIAITPLLGVFVTAKLRGKAECRQGWVIQADPLRIRGKSGTEYDCEGTPTVVINPPVPKPFRVCWRNPGHWDINTDEGRWKIRGESGNFSVQDERYRPYPVWDGFATVDAAMAFVCARLMRDSSSPNAELRDRSGSGTPPQNQPS